MDSGVGSRYELIELIGAGGMAEVFRARMIGAVGFEKQVAIKRILPDYCADEEFVQRFIDEARLTARLVHPNICQILDFGTMDDRYFITMEYVDGLDLMAVCNGVDRDDEKIPVDVTMFIACGVLRGLKYAHEATDEGGQPLGIVHRDVSPSNVLLSVNGDVKLSDLGAATANPEVRSARTQRHFRLGKVLYMAPEQRRMHVVDARADLYSVGILLSEMLLGESRFHKNANMFLAGLCTLWDQVDDELSSPLGEALAKVIERALAEDPARRFQSAEEMLGVLDRLMVEYAPGTSVDRVARLVARIRRRFTLAREDSEMLEKPEVSAAISLNTGDLQPISRPSEPRDQQQEAVEEHTPVLPGYPPAEPEDEPTFGGRGRGANGFGAVGQVGDDELEESPTIAILHRITPADVAVAGLSEHVPTIADSRAYDHQDAPVESPLALLDHPIEDNDIGSGNRRSAPEAGWAPRTAQARSSGPVAAAPEQDHEPRTRRARGTAVPRWFSGAAIAVILATVLVVGLVFGGVIADRFLARTSPGEDQPSGPGRDARRDVSTSSLISATPAADAAVEPPRPDTAGSAAPARIGDAGVAVPTAGDGGSTPGAGTVGPSPVPDRREVEGEPRPERPAEHGDTSRPERPESHDEQRPTGFGTLNIGASPYGIPYVDDRQIASETPVAGYRVPAGQHRVTVHFPQLGRSVQRIVVIQPDETEGVFIDLSDE
jgi:serine/threonine protein kinase